MFRCRIFAGFFFGLDMLQDEMGLNTSAPASCTFVALVKAEPQFVQQSSDIADEAHRLAKS